MSGSRLGASAFFAFQVRHQSAVTSTRTAYPICRPSLALDQRYIPIQILLPCHVDGLSETGEKLLDTEHTTRCESRMTSKTVSALIALVLVIFAAGWWVLARHNGGQGPAGAAAVETGASMVEVQLPDTLSAQALIGQRGFEGLCAQCHGENAAGRQGFGPPLVHRIYEPSHHADAAFLLAAQNGVRAHHWNFGSMPPVDGVTPADVMAITAYVRELQRANGIN